MPNKSGKPKPKARKDPKRKSEVLKVEGDWKDTIKKALGKKYPGAGWPKA